MGQMDTYRLTLIPIKLVFYTPSLISSALSIVGFLSRLHIIRETVAKRHEAMMSPPTPKKIVLSLFSSSLS